MLFLLHASIPPTKEHGGAAHALQSAAAHTLLTELVQRLGIEQPRIVKTAQGRPYLVDHEEIDFNLAHTATLAVCALWHETGRVPRVGVDAETMVTYGKEKLNAFSARFFAPCEQSYVSLAPNPQEAFTRVFVRKEAYAKYCGDGLGAHLRATDTLAPDFETAHGVRFLTYREQETFITLCLPRDCQEDPQTALSSDP